MTNTIDLIKSSTEQSGYDKSSWIKEADRHQLSAKLLRNIRKRRRSKVGYSENHVENIRHIQTMDATVQSSTLLIAYAVELYLKVGLTALYVGCSKELFKKKVKHFGHDLVKLANSVEFPISNEKRNLLKWLNKVILYEGRYPPYASNMQDKIKILNERARRFWSDEEFEKIVELSSRIRLHVSKIDGDKNNPATWINYRIDQDGYFAFRCGGNLKPRITVRFSSNQRSQKKNNKRELKRLILRKTLDPWVATHWDTAIYRCVKF